MNGWAVPDRRGAAGGGADFRRAVLKGPPWFLAVLIIIAIGVIMSQVVFSSFRLPGGDGIAVTITGFDPGGGGDRAPGGDRDQSEDSLERLDRPSDLKTEEPDFESMKSADDGGRPVIGPSGSTDGEKPRSEPPLPAADVRRESGGGPGKGRGSGSGEGSPWSMRTGPGRSEGVRKYGGSAASESAVEAGLDWLARHQSGDGRFDGDGYDKACADGSCGRNVMCVDCDQGLTGLALMAFLGAGYSHQKGKHVRTVLKGLQFLLSMQDDDGSFSERNNMRSIYNQSIALIALSEAYGQTGDLSLAQPIRRGLEFLVRAQQPGGGWTYTPSPAAERNDTSITGFAVMALRAAKEAGLDAGEAPLDRARRHINRATLPSGEVLYADAGTRAGDRGAGMIAVGLFTSFLLGRLPEHPVAAKQLGLLRTYPPSWNAPDGADGRTRTERKRYMSISNTMYYWYYATLATFCAGGADWEWWNLRIRDLLVARQRKNGCAAGSWDPADLWAEDIGRVFSTAINILTLEIYYRYVPGFLLNACSGAWETGGGDKEASGEKGRAEEERLRKLKDLVGEKGDGR